MSVREKRLLQNSSRCCWGLTLLFKGSAASRHAPVEGQPVSPCKETPSPAICVLTLQHKENGIYHSDFISAIIFPHSWNVTLLKSSPAGWEAVAQTNTDAICLPLPPRDSREGRGWSGGRVLLWVVTVRSLGSGSESGEPASGAEDVPVLRLQRLPQWSPLFRQADIRPEAWRVRGKVEWCSHTGLFLYISTHHCYTRY